MSSDLNRVVLIGRLTRDPELRYTPSGTAVAGFSLANNRTYAVTGEKKDQVSYFDCVAWAKLGEIITEYGKKGHRIAIEGRLQQRRWDDQDGKKRSKIEIVVETFQFLTDKKSGDSQPTGKGIEGIGTPVTGKDPTWEDANPFSDDDIEF